MVGAVALATTGTSLRPSFKDRELLVRWDATPSTSLPEMDRITRRASAELRSVPGVRDVGAHIGRAVSGDQAVGTGSGEMWVTMDDSADYDATLGSIRDVVGGYPGVRGRVLTYESERSRRRLRRRRTTASPCACSARTTGSCAGRRSGSAGSWPAWTACGTRASSSRPTSRRSR